MDNFSLKKELRNRAVSGMKYGKMNAQKFAVLFLIGQLFVLYVSFKIFGQNVPESSNPQDLLKFVDASFSGVKIRNWDESSLSDQTKASLALVKPDHGLNCERWAVVTTIYGPSDSVRKIAQSKDSWCLVIVGDKKTPSREAYLEGIGAANNKDVVFLSPEDQDRLYPLLSNVIPWNEMARKNLGYMYAIKHGASLIWDFDDDNMNILPADIVEATKKYRIPCSGFSNHLFNTYPYFDVNETHTWPRGFPLEHIRDSSTIPKLCTSSTKRTIGVVQSLANLEPDVDAIYRFTRDTPFSFRATPKSHLPVMVPKNSFTPFNAQATLWVKDAFIYLAFPASVNYRISDIWRAYITLYFFHRKSMHLLFVPPYIDQYRNAHDYLKDFNDELDIYQKSKKMLKWLSTHTSAETLVELYRDMFERDYLHERDMHFIDAWVRTFES